MITKKTVYTFGIFFPLFLHAVGMGVSVPITFYEKEKLSYSTSDIPTSTYEYEPHSGIGFVFDSNVGQEKTFSYRFNFEYSIADIESSSRLYSSNLRKHKFNFVNTFGFGVIQERYLRFWVGPRINIQYEHTSSDSNIRVQNSYGIGLAAAAGLNVIMAERVSLACDVDYHGTLLFGGESYRDYDGTTTGDVTHYTGYIGTNRDFTVRLYLLFVFGEQYEERAVAPAEDSVIDYSL